MKRTVWSLVCLICMAAWCGTLRAETIQGNGKAITKEIYETADVISTYLYRYGLLGAKYGMGTAIGLMNSVINIIILVSVNKAFSRLTENSLW